MAEAVYVVVRMQPTICPKVVKPQWDADIDPDGIDSAVWIDPDSGSS